MSETTPHTNQTVELTGASTAPAGNERLDGGTVTGARRLGNRVFTVVQIPLDQGATDKAMTESRAKDWDYRPGLLKEGRDLFSGKKVGLDGTTHIHVRKAP